MDKPKKPEPGDTLESPRFRSIVGLELCVPRWKVGTDLPPRASSDSINSPEASSHGQILYLVAWSMHLSLNDASPMANLLGLIRLRLRLLRILSLCLSAKRATIEIAIRMTAADFSFDIRNPYAAVSMSHPPPPPPLPVPLEPLIGGMSIADGGATGSGHSVTPARRPKSWVQ